MLFPCVTGAGFDITEHSRRKAACYIAQVWVSSLNQYAAAAAAAAAAKVEIYKKRKKESKKQQHEPADSIIILPEVERGMKETLKW